ncbi:MAG: hypothetical protein GC202_02410 [Alphaproteobacteria bacterium]|nr:hypothetical protein [Alphaproteobacteria bacterium]
MIDAIQGASGAALNPFVPGANGAEDHLAKMRKAIDDLERSRFDAQLYGRQLRQSANEAAARAIKLLSDAGASTEHLKALAEDLARHVIRDVETRGPDAINVPQGLVAGAKFSFSLEIERLSFTAGADGSFSFHYEKLSLSITAESYVAGLGASPDQTAAYFAPGNSGGLLLPEKGEKNKFRLLVPIDPHARLWSQTA